MYPSTCLIVFYMDKVTINPPDRDDDPAVDLIRGKLDALYAEEPDAKEEVAEVEQIVRPVSKHQKYMKALADSCRSLAEIQTAWHEYYIALPDKEKHEVWQEFYAEHEKSKQAKEHQKNIAHEVNEEPKQHHRPAATPKREAPDSRNSHDVKDHLIGNVQRRSRKRDSHHFKALVFGLGMGSIVIFIFMFSFFNERFITPFIRPSANVSATPIIVDPSNNGPVSPEPKIIIPKINLEAPVVYDVPTIEEKDVQKGLENGVVHYITTPNPGEKGNSVIFGHSSSNILNKGKYKFAFILLKSLEPGDTFIIQKDSKRYVYKVYNKFITDPKDLSVLETLDRPATMTLITCDPPGTSTNRLIIQAEQIFPDPATNKDSTASGVEAQPKQLPSNSPSLWSRMWSWL